MIVLGGIGTLWGGPVGAAIVVRSRTGSRRPGFEGIGIVTGAVFVLVVLLFRRGIWGTARQVVAWFQRRRRQRGQSKMSLPGTLLDRAWRERIGEDLRYGGGYHTTLVTEGQTNSTSTVGMPRRRHGRPAGPSPTRSECRR